MTIERKKGKHRGGRGNGDGDVEKRKGATRSSFPDQRCARRGGGRKSKDAPGKWVAYSRRGDYGADLGLDEGETGGENCKERIPGEGGGDRLPSQEDFILTPH